MSKLKLFRHVFATNHDPNNVLEKRAASMLQLATLMRGVDGCVWLAVNMAKQSLYIPSNKDL